MADVESRASERSRELGPIEVPHTVGHLSESRRYLDRKIHLAPHNKFVWQHTLELHQLVRRERQVSKSEQT